MKLLPVTLLLLTSVLAASPVRADCPRPWIFFDLGQTLIDTQGNTMKNMTYMTGARDYLAGLEKDGYALGMIVNWPEKDGATQLEKQQRMKTFIESGWAGAPEPRFDWTAFPPELMLLSNTTAERKPAPALYLRALALAGAVGCQAVFMGEDAKEVDAARANGMRAWLLGTPGGDPEAPLYAPREFLLGY
jgi:phosphoglycolate phosphatase-like HAD superfamily hydrolase